MKTPKFITKLSAVLIPRPRKKLQATARAVPRAAMDDYDADEPTTKLSSAFVVVLILHIVAVLGIFAFNSIKASRLTHEKAAAPADAPAKSPAAAAAQAPASAVPRAAEHPTPAAPVPAVASLKPAGATQHSVQANENPTKIAIAYRLRTEELLAANGLKDGDILKIGQVLTIPAPKTAGKSAATEPAKTATPARDSDVLPTRTTPGKHVVKKGDTAFSIAKTYGLSADELLRLNKITDAKKLQPGQALTIPKKKG